MTALRPQPVRLMVIATAPQTLRGFFERQLAFFAAHGFDVHAVSSPGDALDALGRHAGIATHGIRMERRPHPFRDLVSLVALIWLILRCRPRIVHAHTPKAGLLAMLASTLTLIPIRLYTIHGLPLMTRRGWRRKFLELSERLTCALATHTYCVSASVEAVARELHLCRDHKLSTVGDGSCAGVDLDRFQPRPGDPERRRAIRRLHHTPEAAPLLCYVGRLARDKGVEVLASAWARLAIELPDLHLLCCGGPDPTDPVPGDVLDALRAHPRVRNTHGFVADMPPIYAASDIVVLPTFREGLPQVVIEASAMQVPVVASRVPGVVNAVQDGVTGILVPPADPTALAAAIRLLVENRSLRMRLGKAGREFVAARFAEARVNRLYLAEYRAYAAPAPTVQSAPV